MKISIELFLLDNTLMNYSIFALASVLTGKRLRIGATMLFALAGAVYAFLSMFVLPFLAWTPLKLLFFAALAIPLCERNTSVCKTLLAVLLSAFLLGGAVLGVTVLCGGTVQYGGALIGTVPVRASVWAIAAAITLPRVLRTLLRKRDLASGYTTLRILYGNRVYRVRALIDTGNLLVEPLSGLPVVLWNHAVIGSRPVPYGTMHGKGMLYAMRPERVTLLDYDAVCIDCYLARSPQPIPNAGAVLPASLLPQDWRKTNARLVSIPLASPALAAAVWQTRYLLVHSYKRKPPRTAQRGGGGAVHCGVANGQGSQG